MFGFGKEGRGRHTSDGFKNVSRETMNKLTAYVSLLKKWNSKINLVGKSTEDDLWERHIADALQLLHLIPENVRTLADMGSGAGLPGIILAIARPDLEVSLIEIDQRKSAFLREAATSLSLANTRIINDNIDHVTDQFDLVTARALASLPQLFALAYPRINAGAICLFPKGRNFVTEVEEALLGWQFACHTTPSTTEEGATILRITNLSAR